MSNADFPKVLAVRHYTLGTRNKTLEDANTRLLERLKQIAGDERKHTLFLEGQRDEVEEIKKSGIPKQKRRRVEPFLTAIKFALDNDWDIVGVDRPEMRSLGAKSYGDEQAWRYVNRNMRERYWTGFFTRNNACNDDVFLVHPDHARSFMQDAGRSASEIEWISNPRKKGAKGTIERLSPDELTEFLNRRDSEREKRKQKTRSGNPPKQAV